MVTKTVGRQLNLIVVVNIEFGKDRIFNASELLI